MMPALPLILLTLILSLPTWGQSGPRVIMPTKAPPNPAKYAKVIYPWRQNITATVFWIGERPTQGNPTPNHASSWDTKWQKNYGGYDDPNPTARANFAPKAFRPKLNPFYVALPYNDCVNHRLHKPEAQRLVPWLKRYQHKPGDSGCRGRWLQIVYKGKSCFAQWEDCGPFHTDDWKYVFGGARPKNAKNQGAGIDLSPAVRDYLGLKSGAKVHWRFTEFARIPRGPWAMHGTNNPFVNAEANPDLALMRRYNSYLKKMRDEAYQRKDIGS
jgi:hypothetical protein